jgi:hypothetical protein
MSVPPTFWGERGGGGRERFIVYVLFISHKMTFHMEIPQNVAV